MAVIRCEICGQEYDEAVAKCVRCGTFFMYGTENMSDEDRKKRDEYLESQRRKWNVGIIGICVYKNVVNEGSVEVESEDIIRLADLKELNTGELFWYNEDFARMSGSSNITVTIQKGDGSLKKCIVNINDPLVPDDSYWHLGIVKTAEKSFKIALGNGEKQEFSKEIAVE